MNAPKAIGLVLGGVALFFVITEPTAAAAAVQGVVGALKDGAEAVITFLTGLFN